MKYDGILDICSSGSDAGGVNVHGVLFGSMGTKQEGRDVRSYGVILPMFVLHIIGYILTVGIWAAVPVLYRYGVDLEYLWAVPLAVDLVYTLTLTVTEAVCVRVSARRAAADGK